MTEILFVDDEPYILDGLSRMMNHRRREWTFHFAQSPEEAIDVIHDHKPDILVSDMVMPGMGGMQLIAMAMFLHPAISPIVLSGNCSWPQADWVMQQGIPFISKPCGPGQLSDCIEASIKGIEEPAFLAGGPGS